VLVVGGVPHRPGRQRGVGLACIRVGPGDRGVVGVLAAGSSRPRTGRGARRGPGRRCRRRSGKAASGQAIAGQAVTGKRATRHAARRKTGAGKLRLAVLPLRWLLALRLSRPGLLGVVLGGGRARAVQARRGETGRLPAGIVARRAAVTGPLAVTVDRLAPAGLCGASASRARPLASRYLAAGSLAPWCLVAAGRRPRDRGGRVVPVLPVLAGAASLVLAGLLVPAGDERLGLLRQLRLGLGAARGYPVGAPVGLGLRRL